MSDKPHIKINATAKIQITLEVDASAWGEDCSIGQLFDQAKEDGLSQIYQLIQTAKKPVRIIGEPKVIGVLATK